MKTKIVEIEGIGPVFTEKLNGIGIMTVEDLLKIGATKSGRKKLAEDTGISESRLLTWINMADLFRIKGVGPQFAELLEACGVDTVKELRNRNAENLHTKMIEIQAEMEITGTVPGLKQVADYIDQAKTLDPIITY